MIDIRPIEPSELRAWIEAMHTIYFMTNDVEEEQRYRAERVDYRRALGAFDGDSVVATFRSFPTVLFVPGGRSIPADAITNVGVLPTHRRQGILTTMMECDLRAARERGEAVGILFASDARIYGRYGFGVATEHAQILIRKEHARFRAVPEGRVDLVSFADFRQIGPAIHDRLAALQPGSIAIDAKRWDAMTGVAPSPFAPKAGERVAVFRDDEGEPQGWIRYTGEETWVETRPQGTLKVAELVAATTAAYARLWRYALELDLIAEVRAEGRPLIELLPWLLTDRRVVHPTGRHDGLWVRVLDPVAALSARTYLSAGGLVLEIRDQLGLASGRFRVEGGPEGARCEPTSAEPDISTTVEGLGAAYLGGTKLSMLAAAGLLEEHRPGALARGEAMFASPVVPWSWIEF